MCDVVDRIVWCDAIIIEVQWNVRSLLNYADFCVRIIFDWHVGVNMNECDICWFHDLNIISFCLHQTLIFIKILSKKDDPWTIYMTFLQIWLFSFYRIFPQLTHYQNSNSLNYIFYYLPQKLSSHRPYWLSVHGPISLAAGQISLIRARVIRNTRTADCQHNRYYFRWRLEWILKRMTGA